MKKLLFLLNLIIPVWSFAQSATIFPNSISVPKVSALPACNTNQKGTQVMNATDNKMYYCNGTNWQEMTGGGFTLPYRDSINSNSDALYLENSSGGRAIYAKTAYTSAIRAESVSGYGLFAKSDSYYGIYGTSSSSIGIYGISSTYIAGYFESGGNQPTIFVLNNGSGLAADLRGGVNIRDELTVSNGKGIVSSNSDKQQKVVRMQDSYSATSLAAGAYKDVTLNYEDFGALPTVTVGQVMNSVSTGDWYKVLATPINVSATSCQIRLYNTSNAAITFNATWHFVIIGVK